MKMSKVVRDAIQQNLTRFVSSKQTGKDYTDTLDSMEAEIDSIIIKAKKDEKQEWLKEKHTYYDTEIAKAQQKMREAEFEVQKREEVNGELHERNKRLHDEIKKLQRKAKKAKFTHFPLGEIKPTIVNNLDNSEVMFLRNQVDRLTKIIESIAIDE
jgi:predicted RNase H-like nuclease (RuvC/YqgF family)